MKSLKIYQDIVGLDVSVRDAVLVNLGKTLEKLVHQLPNHGQALWVACLVVELFAGELIVLGESHWHKVSNKVQVLFVCCNRQRVGLRLTWGEGWALGVEIVVEVDLVGVGGDSL